MLIYIDAFNQSSRWIATQVLRGETPAERATMIAKFVELANQLLMLKNYNGLMSVLSALNGSALFRLKRSWSMLPEAVMHSFEQLNEFMNPSFNYKVYRAALLECQTRQETYLAFIGVTHTDLTFGDDANEDWLSGIYF